MVTLTAGQRWTEEDESTWKPRASVSPGCFPPNQAGLVAVNAVPVVGVVSASQKVSLVTGALISSSIEKEEMAAVMGRMRVASKAEVELELQLGLLPESRAAQLPETPDPGRKGEERTWTNMQPTLSV